jgi:hypothetical protein
MCCQISNISAAFTIAISNHDTTNQTINFSLLFNTTKYSWANKISGSNALMQYYQGHNINSKITFTLLTSFFTFVMFLSFVL